MADEIKAPEAPATEPTPTEVPKQEATPAPPVAEKPAEVVAPVYNLKIPEGSKIEPQQVDRIKGLAESLKLTPEQAQGLLDTEHKAFTEYIESRKKEVTGWIDEIKNDKVYGGEKLKENMELVRRDLERDELGLKLKKDLDSSEYGNYPNLFRYLVDRLQKTAEDKIVHPEGSPPTVKLKSDKEVFFNTP